LQAATDKYGFDANRRSVIIHGQFMREDQVNSYNSLGVIPSLFPMHTFYWGDWHRDHTVGPELADNISPTGWVRERGMIFSTHHDAPVAFPNSMRVLDATVTRRSRSGDIIGPAQRVDVMTALKAMTIWPAFHHFEEGKKGTIEVGKLGDLVVLSADPRAVDPDSLDTLVVEETIKEGTTVYVAGGKQGNLNYRPLPDGRDPFGEYLRDATEKYETGQMFGKMSPFAALARGSELHSNACVAQFMAALLDGDGKPPISPAN
jgi:hypothetical protein